MLEPSLVAAGGGFYLKMHIVWFIMCLAREPKAE